jgi:hypothetical protein
VIRRTVACQQHAQHKIYDDLNVLKNFFTTSTILAHFLDKFFASMLLFLTGTSPKATPWDIQVERTTKTASIADRELKARFLIAIILKYYFLF